jgi:hypothetical protein
MADAPAHQLIRGLAEALEAVLEPVSKMLMDISFEPTSDNLPEGIWRAQCSGT